MAESIVGTIRAHERGLRRPHTSDAFDARMRTAIASHRPRAWAWAWTVAASIVVLALGLGLLRQIAPGLEAGETPPHAVSRLAGSPVKAHACRRDFEGGVVELDGRCRLEIEGPGITVETWTRARIEPRADGLFVHDGLVLVDVEKVRPGAAPVRVGVEGGTIEVLGTQFVVYQGGAGGEVELMEGKIRFSHTGGDVVDMGVGDRLRWEPRHGQASEPQPEPTAAPKAEPTAAVPSRSDQPAAGRRKPRPTAPEPAPDLNAELAEIARLREARRFDAALDRIRALPAQARLPIAIAEVLSFEEGTLLEAKGATEAACRHWDRHTTRFPAGRYASEALRHRHVLACGGAEVPGD